MYICQYHYPTNAVRSISELPQCKKICLPKFGCFKAMFTRCARYYYPLEKQTCMICVPVLSRSDNLTSCSKWSAIENQAGLLHLEFDENKRVHHCQLLLMQPLQNIVTPTAFHISSNEKAIPLTVIHILCIVVDRPAMRLLHSRYPGSRNSRGQNWLRWWYIHRK